MDIANTPIYTQGRALIREIDTLRYLETRHQREFGDEQTFPTTTFGAYFDLEQELVHRCFAWLKAQEEADFHPLELDADTIYIGLKIWTFAEHHTVG